MQIAICAHELPNRSIFLTVWEEDASGDDQGAELLYQEELDALPVGFDPQDLARRVAQAVVDGCHRSDGVVPLPW